MMPLGVLRIIRALAANDDVRDAMIGDFQEEYDERVRHYGVHAARLWCWVHAGRSLVDSMLHSRPAPRVVVSSVLPGVLWGYLVIATSSLALAVLLSPAIAWLLSVTSRGIVFGVILAFASPTAILGGYEAARVGRGAGLWSAMALGLALIAGSVFVYGAGVSGVHMVTAHVGVRLFGPRMLVAVLSLPFCVGGGVLHEARERVS